MIGLLQRVSEARVDVAGVNVGKIGHGVLLMVCAERGDDESHAERLLERVLNYRVFSDDAGKMNRSLRDVQGGLLLVPQFTLAADTGGGTRPSFSPAADPETGRRLFEHMLQLARARHESVAAGAFGARMSVALVNDGPVTFWLRAAPGA